ncbi:MAG TPA: tRNA-dihydrouridine synthase [Desulfomonilaceae bacterium]|nr:tRNA-dihydrouridine synthase [Desulfomonilaceae bacterium]
MKTAFATLMEQLPGKRLKGLTFRSPFTIPSGIVTTVSSTIARIALEIPEIGFLTTKTLSIEPRAGYREPVLHEYHPGCFVNAVGLANPGAVQFRDTMRPLLPLHDSKPLVISIMGQNPEEFLECALILEPIADAFELNFSCPHVKGAGQCVGSDPDAVTKTLRLLSRKIHKPVIPKLSPNLGDISGMARVCEQEGADALCLINTVGPGMAMDTDGNPVLTNVVGGLSGSGILPMGLKAVKEAASAVRIPIIAAGGIATAEDVHAYLKAGASFFAIGSALAGMTTSEVATFFAALVRDLSNEDGNGPSPVIIRSTASRTSYSKTRVTENIGVGGGIFRISLEKGPVCDPGKFFFLRLPDIGEKPFSPARDTAPVYLVRAVGPFTRALEKLKPGDTIFMRGPYGKGYPEPNPATRVVLIGGGTGAAPVLLAARRWSAMVAKGFFGFSDRITEDFARELQSLVPDAVLAVDSTHRVGEVVTALKADLAKCPETYSDCIVFLCGPSAMMQAAMEALGRGNVERKRIFIAREDVMRCGIGLCGSCGTRTGLRSCTDGPVMGPDE